jgi:hypothetical protein
MSARSSSNISIAERDQPQAAPTSSNHAIAVAVPNEPHHQQQPPVGYCRDVAAVFADIMLILVLVIPLLVLSFAIGVVYAALLIVGLLLFCLVLPFTHFAGCGEPPYETIFQSHASVVVTPITTTWRWRTQMHDWILNREEQPKPQQPQPKPELRYRIAGA